MEKIKTLFVSSEVAPFTKTGGLADVAGSLPKELSYLEIDIRVVMPKFKNIPDKYVREMKSIGNGTVDILFKKVGFEIFMLEQDNIKYYFIEHDDYFCRDGYYGYGDDGERFIFFSKAVFEMLPLINFKPDIIHSNDWQTASVNVLAKAYYAYQDYYKNIKTVFSIHNIKYQGVYPKEIINSLLGIGWDNFTYDKLEFHDQVNLLKGAIKYSDAVNTVSETYSNEIKHDFFAENLGGVTRSREDLYGIVNGIDYAVFNPETDENIFATFNKDTLQDKYKNKKMLQQSLGLPVKKSVPIISIITRLVENKGIDLINAIIDDLMQQDVQFIALGTGEYRYEESFKYFANKYPKKFSANILYDSVLSHRIYAGSDMFLVPSLFEPCGLSQLISLRYGTVPIVRETGGLKDTIKPYNKFTSEGNGFTFSNYNAHELLDSINRAIELYKSKVKWNKLINSGMEDDFSWSTSAKKYFDIYKNLCD